MLKRSFKTAFPLQPRPPSIAWQAGRERFATPVTAVKRSGPLRAAASPPPREAQGKKAARTLGAAQP